MRLARMLSGVGIQSSAGTSATSAPCHPDRAPTMRTDDV
jgi:hypothetical protein